MSAKNMYAILALHKCERYSLKDKFSIKVRFNIPDIFLMFCEGN